MNIFLEIRRKHPNIQPCHSEAHQEVVAQAQTLGAVEVEEVVGLQLEEVRFEKNWYETTKLISLHRTRWIPIQG